MVFAFTTSLLAIRNPMLTNVGPLLDLTFLLPFVLGTTTYAALKTMREEYMYNLNRRCYWFRLSK